MKSLQTILVTGSRGQLGRDCVKVLGNGYRVIGADRSTLDLLRHDVGEYLDRVRPDVVINCAALTDVDACEGEQGKAWMLNAVTPGRIAEWCATHDRFLVQISTDYVFGNKQPRIHPYDESDPAYPESVYGMTKWLGEQRIDASGARAAILRTAWLYGASGNNFLKTMLRLHLENPEHTLKVVDDQHGSPTWTWRLAQQIRSIVLRRKSGRFHAAGEGAATWKALAEHFFAELELPARIAACGSDAFPRPAPRPDWSVLGNRALSEQECNIMRPWREDVSRFVRHHGVDLIRECTPCEAPQMEMAA